METLQKVSDEIDQENSRNSYVNNYFQFRDLYTRQMQLNFFQKVISGTTISPDDLEKIPVHKTSDYLTILMEIHNANPEIWDEKVIFLCSTPSWKIYAGNLTACVQRAYLH